MAALKKRFKVLLEWWLRQKHGHHRLARPGRAWLGSAEGERDKEYHWVERGEEGEKRGSLGNDEVNGRGRRFQRISFTTPKTFSRKKGAAAR